MSAFDPEQHGFIPLSHYKMAEGVSTHEYQCHPDIDGAHDFLRLNIYLSKDGSFVNIWWGLLDVVIGEAKFHNLFEEQYAFFSENYVENLFRGYIESTDEAKTILHALRVGSQDGRFSPQMLMGAPDKLQCERWKPSIA